MKPKTIITTLATIVGLSATAHADPIVKAEVFGSNKSVLGELKVGTDIQAGPVNTQVFVRDRLTTKYDGSMGNFMNNQLRMGDAYGLGATAQVRVVTAALPESPEQYGITTIPQAGLTYTTRGTDWKFAADATAPVNGPTQLELLFNESYAVGRVVLEKEDLFVLGNGTMKDALDETGVKGSTRAHVGYKPLELLTLGVAAEVDYGSHAVPDQRAGLFVRMGK